MIKRNIWVTFQKAGFHRYPAAETDPQLNDVKYLGSVHRHLFKFKVSIQIFHNDRELEFHQFLNYCESLFSSGTLDIDYKSVEMLAEDLYSHIGKRYPGRHVTIDISEDGEAGCCLEFDPVFPTDFLKAGDCIGTP